MNSYYFVCRYNLLKIKNVYLIEISRLFRFKFKIYFFAADVGAYPDFYLQIGRLRISALNPSISGTSFVDHHG